MGQQWDDPGPSLPRLRWRWRRHQAAHNLWTAEEAYRRRPTDRNDQAVERAADHLHQVDAARP